MPTLRVIADYRVFGQDYLAGTTVVVPEREQAERLLAFRFQYAADMLAVFELVREPECADGAKRMDAEQAEAAAVAPEGRTADEGVRDDQLFSVVPASPAASHPAPVEVVTATDVPGPATGSPKAGKGKTRRAKTAES